MSLNKFIDLDATGEEINNLVVDITEIMKGENYSKPIVLKQNYIGNPKERDFLAVDPTLIRDINAIENQFIISDGHNWAKSSAFKELKIDRNESKSEKDEYFISGPEKQLNGATSFIFGGNGRIIEEEVEITTIDPNTQEEITETITKSKFSSDCSLSIEDNAVSKFIGGADIEIGKKGENFSIFGQNKNSPFIRIQNASYIVLDDSIEQSGPPVLLMHGGAYFDISDGQEYNTQERLVNPLDIVNWGVRQTENNSSENGHDKYYPDCPWSNNGSWYQKKGSLFHFHDNSTIIMEGAPVLQLRDDSVFAMMGSSKAIIKGGKDNVENNSNEDTRETLFLLDPGSIFKMNAKNDDNENSTILLVEGGQLYYGHQKDPSLSATGAYQDNVIDHSNLPLGSIINDITKMIGSDENGTTGVKNKLSEFQNITRTENGISYYGDSSYGLGPSILVQASSGASAYTKISSDIDSHVFIEKGATGGSLLINHDTIQDNSTLCINHTLGTDAKYVLDVSPSNKSNTFLQVSPDYEANFTATLTPSGECGIQFSPSGTFLLDYNSHTDYKNLFYPDFYQEYVAGNIFKQMNGIGHYEFQDGGSLILRRNQVQPFSGGLVGQLFDDINGFTFTTKNDYTSLTMDDLKNNSEDFKALQKALKTYNISSEDVNKKNKHSKYVGKGEIISSTSSHAQKYKTIFNMQKITFPVSSDLSVNITNSMTDSEIRQAFLDTCRGVFGNSAIITNNFSYEKKTVRGQLRAKITSDLKLEGINYESYLYTNSVYNIGDTYSNLTAEDKALIDDSYPFGENISPVGYVWFAPRGTDQQNALSVILSQVRPDLTYSTKINNFIYIQVEGHAQQDWNCPIQSKRIYDNYDINGPIVQLYDSSNFLMRGTISTNMEEVKNSTIQKTDYPDLFLSANFEITNKNEVDDIINYLITNDANFATSFNTLDLEYYISKIVIKNADGNYQDVDSRAISVYITYRYWSPGEDIHLQKNTDSPTFEMNDEAYIFMTGKSELKLEDGTIIKAKNNNGTVEYIFGDESDINNQVTFTINELKALKALLSNP